jgi:hypothetical protein
VHPTRLRGFRQGQSPGFGLDAGRGASSPSGEAWKGTYGLGNIGGGSGKDNGCLLNGRDLRD